MRFNRPSACLALSLLLLPLALPARAAADLARERAELLRLQEQARRAHLTYDADLLVSAQTDDFLSISAGQVNRTTRDQARQMFARYFASVRFVAWDDIAPPRIDVSADGSLATVIVEKFVHLTARSAPAGAAPQEVKRRYAWMETWRKEAAGWRMTALASTDGPWQGELALTSAAAPVFEFACHKGNYSLGNFLRRAPHKEGQTRSDP